MVSIAPAIREGGKHTEDPNPLGLGTAAAVCDYDLRRHRPHMDRYSRCTESSRVNSAIVPE
jgi:hypothetical protein